MKPEPSTQVLMIDDDENDAMLVRQMVGKIPDSGYHLHWAGSYEQGIKVLGEIDWDLCLVDYQLGAHTGVEIVMESRARGVDCPFLLLTGVGSRSIDLQAMRAGAVGYLEKSRLCPLELERAIRYAMGNRRANQPPAGAASSHLPPEAVAALNAAFAAKLPFIVIALAIDRESALRNNLGSSHVQRINTDLETLIRARLSSQDSVFRTSGGVLLAISAQDAREGRQLLALLLSEPLAVSGGDRSRTVSLLAIVRRNVFSSSGYLCPAALIADLDTFVAPGPRLPGPDFRNF